MIVDVFENVDKYYCLNKRFKRAFEYLLLNDFTDIPCGRYEIDGDNIYANVDEYETKTESRPEYHKKYIDIQFLAVGEEKIGYCNINELELCDNYNDLKDVGFGKSNLSYINMKKGMFMVLFPQDAHQPCMTSDIPQKVKKIVVKVKVD